MSIKPENSLVSVIVCTFNRSLLLRNCLESLANQDAAIEQYEVIVVDNGSTDDTQIVVKEFLTRYRNFRGVTEDRQGLSYARNRGWKEAASPYVAYIDDDAIAYSDWISGITRFIGRKPEIGIFGGPYDPFYLVPVPAWFPPEYGKFELGEEERFIELGSEWIVGLNMVINKELFNKHGGFDVRLGMSGSKTAYGEEVKFFLSMRDKGIQIFYVPSIRVKHLVAEYKMSLNWMLLSGYSVGRHFELTFNIEKNLFSHLRTFVGGLFVLLYQLMRPVNIPFKRRLYYSLNRLFYEAGAVVEHVSTTLTGIRNDASNH